MLIQYKDDIQFVTEFPCFLVILYVLNQAKPKYEKDIRYFNMDKKYLSIFFFKMGEFLGGGGTTTSWCCTRNVSRKMCPTLH